MTILIRILIAAWFALVIMQLSGCTTVAQQAITGYEAAALKSVEAADDNAIRVWATAACGTPYSAAIRNTQIVPALKALCLPAGATSSPVTLLDTVTVVK
jgi:uncharacterized protein YceK